MFNNCFIFSQNKISSPHFIKKPLKQKPLIYFYIPKQIPLKTVLCIYLEKTLHSQKTSISLYL